MAMLYSYPMLTSMLVVWLVAVLALASAAHSKDKDVLGRVLVGIDFLCWVGGVIILINSVNILMRLL